jgi:Spy/CpxP family protein refolding chaperone
MTKTKILLVVVFLVTFAAGVVAGRLYWQSGHRPPGPSFLAAELNLTAEQREKMHTIWTESMSDGGRRQWDQRKVLGQERDAAIAALMTAEQKPQYEKILQDYTRKLDEQGQERKKAFDQAVEKTKQILTPEQVAKYEELLKRPPHDRGFGGPPGGPPWGDKGPPRHGPPGPGPEPREPPPGKNEK